MSDFQHLGEQFAGVLRRAADMGIELPPDMPGMARIGGLHVPVSLAEMELYNDDDPLNKSAGPGLVLGVPDEKGNVFSVSTRNGDKSKFSVVGPGTSHGHSPEEFVDMYKNAEPPDQLERVYNERTMFEDPRILRHLGGLPGQVVANHMNNAVTGNPVHNTGLMDRTGELSPAAMPLPSALVAASNDWHEYQEAKGRSGYEGGGK